MIWTRLLSSESPEHVPQFYLAYPLKEIHQPASGKAGTLAVEARLDLKTPGNQVAVPIPVRPQSPTAQRPRKAELHGAMTLRVGWDRALRPELPGRWGHQPGFQVPLDLRGSAEHEAH